MKEILIITSYFPPEIGAASNRIFHLADGLQKRQYKVSVITPLPNYPTGKIFSDYKGKFRHSSEENNINIHRLWIYATISKNKFLRLIAMVSYSFSLLLYFIFNKIPLLKRLKLREVASFKMLYGSMSDVNNPNLYPELIQFPRDINDNRYHL